MKRFIFLLVLILVFNFGYSNDKAKFILLITEQNIEGPQKAWWASEVDLSIVESTIARRLIEKGYDVLEPIELNDIIKSTKAFRIVNISEDKSIKLAKLAKADYLILGKAIASAGSKVLNSNMISCYANISAKLIRIKDKKIISYLNASSNSVHLDVISGGKEALEKAGNDLAEKIIDALNKN